MKNVTVTMDEETLRHARIAAASQGKSLSKFIAETIAQRVGRPATQSDALDVFLSSPLMDLTDEDGRAMTRDAIYERTSLR